MDSFTVNELPKPQEVFSITSDKSLKEALELLVKHNVYSLPVYDNQHSFKGLVSLDNIVTVIANLFAEHTDKNQNSASARISHHKFTSKEIKEIQEKFDKLIISDSQVISGCTIVDSNTKITDAIHLILDKKLRLVIGTDKNITNIISPFLLVKFISTHKDLPVFTQHLIDTKARITTPVQSINSNLNVITAFAKMVEGGFSGLAVIEEEKIITTLTFKDISRAVTDFQHLTESTEEYVKQVRQSRIETTTYPTINVSEKDTLSIVTQKFVAVKSHRIFVRRGESIYGITSVSDLLYAFI
eukprot:TRINITY_DN5061_c0_g1_i1.p1 TRINITY_DN5061_c0_g1~~TRINITY_DN5061_c0_g1_i1.p1  ORF type:complete len:300 (+),score=90.50 TRINITY_DN5061_c0_g1_i1:19-918(+)